MLIACYVLRRPGAVIGLRARWQLNTQRLISKQATTIHNQCTLNNKISLDPLRAKKTFIRKKLGHTMVSAIKASSVTLQIWQKVLEENTVILQILIKLVVSKTDMSKNAKIFQMC